MPKHKHLGDPTESPTAVLKERFGLCSTAGSAAWKYQTSKGIGNGTRLQCMDISITAALTEEKLLKLLVFDQET